MILMGKRRARHGGSETSLDDLVVRGALELTAVDVLAVIYDSGLSEVSFALKL